MSFISPLFTFFGRTLPTNSRELRNNLRHNCSSGPWYLLAQAIASGIMSVGMAAFASTLFDLEVNNSNNASSNHNPYKSSLCLTLAYMNGLTCLGSMVQAVYYCTKPNSPFYYLKIIQVSILSTLLGPTSMLGFFLCLAEGIFPRLSTDQSNQLDANEVATRNNRRTFTAIVCSSMYAIHLVITIIHLGTKKITIITHNYGIPLEVLSNRLEFQRTRFSRTFSPDNLYSTIPFIARPLSPTEVQARLLPPIPQDLMIPPLGGSQSDDSNSLSEVYMNLNLPSSDDEASLAEEPTIFTDNESSNSPYSHLSVSLNPSISSGNLSSSSLHSWETTMSEDTQSALNEMIFINIEDFTSETSSNNSISLAERRHSFDVASWYTNSSDDEDFCVESSQLALLAASHAATQDLDTHEEGVD
ncbi:hypothetical protein CLAVI_000526 [Candidatus Clavichlamydia salmonicola]|uniref:hypothetical protein n=1 Tax=Candidatus Clavichlamydia salmonicola TaxID=469812 RepID=UPI0018916B1D|nr:hypothetical protein [Candidatus Clavichlamydia salmonicola]MBF5050904.1 hypothetical protein [Candidatus Clavichlamydia salmonicola]